MFMFRLIDTNGTCVNAQPAKNLRRNAVPVSAAGRFQVRTIRAVKACDTILRPDQGVGFAQS